MNIELTKTKAALVLGGAVVLGLSASGVALASSDDDASETPITGSPLDRASQAALAETGGGKVTGTEIGDEESLYEVEVTLTNGDQVDVQLNAEFQVVGSAVDHEDGQS